MDYKNSILLISKINEELYEFIDSHTDKNVARGTDIVENYVSSLHINEYSIKSFKAKIIHNELEHKRTYDDFQKLLETTYSNLQEVFDSIFANYLEINKKSKSSPTKVTDLREYEITKRRQRQDVINRMNSLEKDFQAKKNQDEEAYNSKYEEYQASLQEEARKLTIDINRIKESTIKSYSSEEKELLAVDDKKRINELKEIIKVKRLEGLKLELEQRYKSYLEIKEKKIAFLDVKNEFDLLMNKQLVEHQEKNAEFKHQIKEIESQIKINSFNYDCNYKIKLYEKLRDNKSVLSSLLRLHNDYLYKNENNLLTDEQKEKFKIAFILTKLYQINVSLYENNIFDPFIDVIDSIINMYKTNNDNFGKNVNMINEKLKISLEQLEGGLRFISLDEKTEKRMTKEDLYENVMSSITRYYNNVINELTMFNNEMQNIMLYIIDLISKKYQLVCERSIFGYNECVYLNTQYNDFDIARFGYQRIEFEQDQNITFKDYYNELCSKLESFVNVINNDYQKHVKNMEKQISIYDNKVEEDTLKHKMNMEKMIKNHEHVINKFESNYEKSNKRKIVKLEREYKKHCRIAKKKNQQKIRVL